MGRTTTCMTAVTAVTACAAAVLLTGRGGAKGCSYTIK